ncbi:MAG: anhydro-N-acetylmuramic acid kinase [Cyanobacteria bacterium HKST-UBA06]|nr:anhydro-N-acetylmuramic acid kinase [Cyanobacteria bacterium HKST-UBA06]
MMCSARQPDTANGLPALNVIGLMSGTSMDAIDAACVRVQLSTNPLGLLQFNVMGTTTVDIPDYVRHDVEQLINQPTSVNLSKLCKTDEAVARCFAKVALALATDLENSGIMVDLIASHGQTIYHEPPKNGQNGCTMQIGNPAIIAQLTQIDTVGDFRPRDMSVGGQGAPLVPFADVLLFSDDAKHRAIQNIGGIANVSVVPSRQSGLPPMAFDTGPGNMIIDGLMKRLFAKPYDDNGQVAAKGRFDTVLLGELMQHPYLQQPPPKSTGREMFGDAFARDLLLDWQDKISDEDLITTATHFTAISIVEAYKQFILPTIPISEVVVGGGGTKNGFLMRLITNRFKEAGIEVSDHARHQIPNQYKEAVAFALLGYAQRFGVANNLATCTGASEPVVLGGCWPGRVNYVLDTLPEAQASHVTLA